MWVNLFLIFNLENQEQPSGEAIFSEFQANSFFRDHQRSGLKIIERSLQVAERH
jgi:hypothetical protein